jgi:hypothetical protein
MATPIQHNSLSFPFEGKALVLEGIVDVIGLLQEDIYNDTKCAAFLRVNDKFIESLYS